MNRTNVIINLLKITRCDILFTSNDKVVRNIELNNFMNGINCNLNEYVYEENQTNDDCIEV